MRTNKLNFRATRIDDLHAKLLPLFPFADDKNQTNKEIDFHTNCLQFSALAQFFVFDNEVADAKSCANAELSFNVKIKRNIFI